MPIIVGKAPGKIILFGEHAVVYGHPAIAFPVSKVTAHAQVYPNLKGDFVGIQVQADDIHLNTALEDLPEEHPLAKAILLTLNEITPDHSSTIPVAAGMGSGAAISVAIIRALSAFLGNPLPPKKISELAFEVEKIHHGTPSGIDNAAITFHKPVYFIRNKPIHFLSVKKPTHWVIADTGDRTPTRDSVLAVRKLFEENPDFYGSIFKSIGDVSQKGRKALIKGDLSAIGSLMNENQKLLEKLDVSNKRLNHLIETAKNAGAVGAKLSGGGRGGNIIALTSPDKLDLIEKELYQAGASHVITTILPKGKAR